MRMACPRLSTPVHAGSSLQKACPCMAWLGSRLDLSAFAPLLPGPRPVSLRLPPYGGLPPCTMDHGSDGPPAVRSGKGLCRRSCEPEDCPRCCSAASDWLLPARDASPRCVLSHAIDFGPRRRRLVQILPTVAAVSGISVLPRQAHHPWIDFNPSSSVDLALKCSVALRLFALLVLSHRLDSHLDSHILALANHTSLRCQPTTLSAFFPPKRTINPTRIKI